MRGRGWSDLDARAGGNQGLALCNHFCLSRPVPLLSLYPDLPPPGSSFFTSIRDAHVCSGREGEERDDAGSTVHAHDRSSKCILIPDAGGMGLHYVGVSTNTHARLRERREWAEERESTLCTPHAFASSSSAPHKAHICVIVPAGSIRPMLDRQTRSYSTVWLKSAGLKVQDLYIPCLILNIIVCLISCLGYFKSKDSHKRDVSSKALDKWNFG